jgi:hypothetical protein
MWMFCRSLFVLLYFFFWQLCRLVFFDIRILITPLVSSNSSNRWLSIDASYQFLLIWLSGFWDDFFFTEIDQPKQKLPMATMFVTWSARWAKISTCLVNQNKSKQWQLQNAISSGKRIANPSGAHEFTLRFQKSLCCTILYFLCNGLHVTVCSFGHCIVCPYSIYGFWLHLDQFQTFRRILNHKIEDTKIKIVTFVNYWYYFKWNTSLLWSLIVKRSKK